MFADPDRTERLVRDYNDAFNNLRPRLFDGSHLDFPGMSKAFDLRQHQKDGAWRCMTGGNTLLAHVVGAGKSGCMVAAGMKMRQAGLASRSPWYVVPNHMPGAVRPGVPAMVPERENPDGRARTTSRRSGGNC